MPAKRVGRIDSNARCEAGMEKMGVRAEVSFWVRDLDGE